jgi:hypothetical protein
LPSQPAKLSTLPPMAVKPQAAESNNNRKRQAEIDLDALMDEFASEMATVGVETKRQPLAPIDSIGTPSRFDAGGPPAGSFTNKLPPRGASPKVAASPTTTSEKELSPLQKLLNSTRYRTTSSNSPALPGSTKALDQDLASGDYSSSGAPLYTSERRALVPTTTALSPSVSSILGKRTSLNAPVVTPQEEIPAWLRPAVGASAQQANSNNFGKRPDVLLAGNGKTLGGSGRSEY